MNTITKYFSKKSLDFNGSKQSKSTQQQLGEPPLIQEKPSEPPSIQEQTAEQPSIQQQPSDPHSIQQQPTNSDQSSSFITITSNQEAETSSLNSKTNENDIGLYIGKKIDDEKKYNLLINHFEPNERFKWPYSERKIFKNGQTIVEKRYLNKSHLDNHKWMKYSLIQKGLFCVPCVLFATTTNKTDSFGKLVNKPLNDYRKLLGENGFVTSHSKSNYHQHNMSKAEHFLFLYIKNPNASIEVSV